MKSLSFDAMRVLACIVALVSATGMTYAYASRAFVRSHFRASLAVAFFLVPLLSVPEILVSPFVAIVDGGVAWGYRLVLCVGYVAMFSGWLELQRKFIPDTKSLAVVSAMSGRWFEVVYPMVRYSFMSWPIAVIVVAIEVLASTGARREAQFSVFLLALITCSVTEWRSRRIGARRTPWPCTSNRLILARQAASEVMAMRDPRALAKSGSLVAICSAFYVIASQLPADEQRWCASASAFVALLVTRAMIDYAADEMQSRSPLLIQTRHYRRLVSWRCVMGVIVIIVSSFFAWFLFGPPLRSGADSECRLTLGLLIPSCALVISRRFAMTRVSENMLLIVFVLIAPLASMP